MAGKARLLANVIEEVLVKEGDEDGNLKGQMAAFKDILIHDISPKGFADVYAQTITYGMFAARLHDPTPDTFSRGEAATLIPKTNPFLRQLFQYVAGIDLDERISWIVDDLAETFRATDMPKIMSGFGKRTAQNDPMIHFYEDFLSAYDSNAREKRGVWYTPQPVVNFIVRAIDDILQNEFHLPNGLADHSKIAIEQSVEQSRDNRYSDKKKKTKVEYHRVQILDPATGTGTFLAEVVSQIYAKFKGQLGLWQSYVDEHLLPRLNGFELLMAPYAMAHLKIDQLLTETGYKSKENKRLRIFLTNSLEEYNKEIGTLPFFTALSSEANEASRIKRDSPMMIILGNPPYSGESQNKNNWIKQLMNDYKKEPNTNQPLKERNPKWVNNDYVKFIRLGQSFVEKTKEGLLAYITDNSFLDGPTFRGMRWNLLKNFDKIYILNLHGNSNGKEVCPDGSKDENVFDIQQGVSINIFIKTGRKNKHELAELYHCDLFGVRQLKYDWLAEHALDNILFNKLSPKSPYYFFVPINETNETEYKKGFGINELMPIHSVGIVTSRDQLVIDFDKENLLKRIQLFADDKKTDDEIRAIFFSNKTPGAYLPGDNRDWSLSKARLEIKQHNHSTMIREISYRPFDTRYIYYSSDMIDFGRESVMGHILTGENIGIVTSRQCASDWRYIFCSKDICNFNLTGTAGRFGSGYVFPLYVYDDNTLTEGPRHPNLTTEIVNKVAKNIGLTFEPEKSGDGDKFAPIDLLDYIYAVLHSPAYREKYKEFLKTDFPRVPYPTSAGEFHRLSALGSELRQIHLMEHSELDRFLTQYPVAGNNTVGKVRWEALSEDVGRVWINESQYFDNVPLTAWEFYIGGYQPAQKWLKDRTGRVLGFDDIFHYQRIIKALAMTEKIMNEL